MFGFYELQLALLTGFCIFSILLERYASKNKRQQQAKDLHPNDAENGHIEQSSSVRVLTWQYLAVYAIVMGADWLQGPYVYSLYRQQFEERIVAILFVTGFVSAGLTAPLVGVWADTYGRKRLCLAFCVTYSLACALILVPSLPVLLCGRVLGGISTSILFSAFEAWLISSSKSMLIPEGDLSRILGRATLINGFVATGAGIVSNELVSSTHSFASPFVLSGLLLVISWIMIKRTWHENYGNDGANSPGSVFQVARLVAAWKIVREDSVLLTLGLAQTCFEGSMYLFVFLWVPSLEEAGHGDLPLGYIFSCFMISMMLGSLLYTAIVSHSFQHSPTTASDSTMVLHAKLSSCICATSALALAISVSYFDEHTRFWAFCVFEACVGMYYPVQGMLRGTLIANEHRATVSSLFRVPLNIFVVVSLLTGVSSARYAVLSASALMLSLSAIVTGFVIVRKDADTRINGNVRPS